MSAHESMEQADHAKEAAGENQKIALLIAVIALCLALSETLGKGAQTESISKNVEASNLWAFFQAKSIRRTVVQTASEQSKLSLGTAGDDAAKAALQKQIDDWQKTAARYRSEPETGEGTEQLSERAKHAEEERNVAMAKYHHFELASAAFQIGIVLASATIITGIPRVGLDLGHAGVGRRCIYRARHTRRRICCICRSGEHQVGDRPRERDFAENLSAPAARSCGSAGSTEACAMTSRHRRRAGDPGFSV